MRIAGFIAAVGLSLLTLTAGAGQARAETGAVPPVPGAVQRGFDPPDRPWLPGHRGVDLLSHPGEPVRAALAGEITFAAELAGRGVVVVSHGSLRTTYEPVDASVTVGASVATGQVIGTLEAGHSCPGGQCLHWGLRRGEQYLNPLSLLDPGPLRLLPSSGTTELSSRSWGSLRCHQARGWACW